MTKKAVISLDLASMVGTLQFVPSPQLPRNDKGLLERTISSIFLKHLSDREGSIITDINSNPNDPPDVIFTYNGQSHGLELSELIPENRFEKDSIIRSIKRQIISQLTLGDNTRGYVITISLINDYSKTFRPGRIGSILGKAIADFFTKHVEGTEMIDVPHNLREIVARISVFRENIINDSRITDDREPLIVFSAQNTMLIPEEDCPKIVESRLSKKWLHNLGSSSWLLLWTVHPALSSFRNDLDNAIGQNLLSRPQKYERVFHLHLFFGSGATEFPINSAK